MDLGFLFAPFEAADERLASLLETSPLFAALLLAAVLGLRHASDPDHLIAVTSIVANRDGDVRAGARIGASWGLGHAAVLVAIGLPLIALDGALPPWLEATAEHLVGLVILALALRLLWRWLQGARPARRETPIDPAGLVRGERTLDPARLVRGERTRAQAMAIGALHGLAGTGAVVVLLIAALPSTGHALMALALFAPMSIASMAACTSAFSWVLTRPVLAPAVHRLVTPAMGAFGVLFGLWYAGIA